MVLGRTIWLRIPDASDRSFRQHSIADSGGIRSPIPEHSITRSGTFDR